jgi:hypothetical protein
MLKQTHKGICGGLIHSTSVECLSTNPCRGSGTGPGTGEFPAASSRVLREVGARWCLVAAASL